MHKNTQAVVFAGWLLACMLAPVALVFLWPAPPFIHLVWDWANAVGFLALALFLLLFVYRGRARTFPSFSGKFFANLHRDLGYIALVLLLVHAGALLLLEPLLLEHLKPSAPLHMLSGLWAMVLTLLLVLSSVPVLRRRLWADYHLFRHIHALLAVAVVVLVGFHVQESAFYLNSTFKSAMLLLVAVSVMAYYSRYIFKVPVGVEGRARYSSRYSHLISYGSTLLAALLLLLLFLVFMPTEQGA